MKNSLFILVLVCFGAISTAQSDAKFDPDKLYHPDSLKSDLDLLQTAMEEVHPGLYRHTSKATIDSVFMSEREKITKPSSYFDFVRSVSRINSQVRCIHTHGIHSPEYQQWRNDSLRRFPFLLKHIDNRLYILENYSEVEEIKAGSEILEIDGQPTSKVINSLLPELHSDGWNNSFKYRQIETRFSKIWSNLRSHDGDFELKIADAATNKKKTYKINGISPDSLNARHGRYLAAIDRINPIKLEVNEDKNTAYLAIRTFNDARLKAFGINYSKKLGEIFLELKEKEIEHLVLDLRDNTGGSTSYGMLLASYLQPGINYVDRVLIKKNADYSFAEHIVDSSGMEHDSVETSPAENGWMIWSNYPNTRYYRSIPFPFKGKVHLMVNGGTLSSASVFTAVIAFNKRARIYGEETGGAYVGPNGAPLIIKLPHSGIRFSIPTASYEVAVPGVQEKGGVIPDFQYSGLIHDHLGRNDPLLKVVNTFVDAESGK